MKITILGSGGFTTTPYVNCQCGECKQARANNNKVRTGPSLYIHDLDLLIDTSKDAPKQIDKLGFFPKNICFSHWHPDHTEGWRVLETFNNKPNVYIQDGSNILDKVPGLEFLNKSNTIKIINWEENTPISKENVLLNYVLLNNNIPVYCFILKQSDKKALIAPDHGKYLLDLSLEPNVDLLVMNLGIDKNSGEPTTFANNLEIIKKFKPKNTVLTHIEAHSKLHDITPDIQLAHDSLVVTI
jgi:phosphoribosyl 1,2-cyclic phosphate phosphodiesterase